MVFFKSTSYKIASEDESARYISNYKLVGTDNWYNQHRCTLVTKFMHNSDKQRLLDFGCGNGIFLKYLYDNGYSMGLSGFDPYLTSKETNDIKILEDKGINFQKQFNNVANTTYDVVTALDVIEHIKDDGKALRDIHRLLKPNGRLLLTVPSHPWLYSLHDAATGHYRRYTSASIQNVLTEAGFTVVEQRYFFIFLVPPSLFVKYYLLVKKIMGRKIGINELPLNPFGIFSLAIRIEEFLMNRGVKFPFGQSLFVYAHKNKSRS